MSAASFRNVALAVCTVLVVLALANPASAKLFDFLSGSADFASFDPKAGTSWLDQIVARKKFPKAFVADSKVLKPYSKASLGPEIAYSVVNSTEFVSQPDEARQFCQAIVDKILSKWPGPVPKVVVRITGDASYGASSNLVGLILVGVGTFNSDVKYGVESQAEMALILGHELAHLLLPHIKDKQSTMDLIGNLQIASELYVTASMVSDTHVVGNQLVVRGDTDRAMKGIVGGLATQILVGSVLQPAWANAAEMEADDLGYDLARNAGYAVDAQTARAFVQKHAVSQAVRSARIEKLKTITKYLLLSNRNVVSAEGLGQAGGIINGMVRLVGPAVIDKVMDTIGNAAIDHPDPAARLAAFNTYLQSAYPKVDEEGNLSNKNGDVVRRLTDTTETRATVESAKTAANIREIMVDQVYAKLPKDSVKAVAAPAPIIAQPKLPSAAVTKADNKKNEPSTEITTGRSLPSPCNSGTPPSVKGPKLKAKSRVPAKTSVKAASAPAGTGGIDPNFPRDNAPFTWSVRADWQSSSPGCQAHAIEDWTRGADSDYAGMDTLHELTVTMTGTPNATKLPAIYNRFNSLIGTDQDFSDLAVAAAVANNDFATAEVKAAQCWNYNHHSLYPVCVKALGYNPLDKSGSGPRTPEGQKAFSHRDLSLSDFTGDFSSLFGE